MFGSISIPIWTRSGGGVETINEPGRYVLYVLITLPQSLIGKSIKIPGTDWQMTVADVGQWSGGSRLSVDVGNVKAFSAEAKLKPLQINALLGIGLFAAFALLVDRVEKASPILTMIVYGGALVVFIFLYVRFVHPLIKRRRKA